MLIAAILVVFCAQCIFLYFTTKKMKAIIQDLAEKLKSQTKERKKVKNENAELKKEIRRLKTQLWEQAASRLKATSK